MNNSTLKGRSRRFRAITDFQLGENVLNMKFCGELRGAQHAADFLVAQTFDQQA